MNLEEFTQSLPNGTISIGVIAHLGQPSWYVSSNVVERYIGNVRTVAGMMGEDMYANEPNGDHIFNKIDDILEAYWPEMTYVEFQTEVCPHIKLHAYDDYDQTIVRELTYITVEDLYNLLNKNGRL